MEKIFDSVRALDKRAEEVFNLKNGVLMEHAARGMAERIGSLFSSPLVQIVCGSAITVATVLPLRGCLPIFAPFR